MCGTHQCTAVLVSVDTSSLLLSPGAQESAAGSPERPGESAGGPQSSGWKPSLPAGRAPNPHRQPQGHPESRQPAEGPRPAGQTGRDRGTAHCAPFSLKRPSSQQPKDRVPPGVPAATAGTAGARTPESRGRSVAGEETAGNQTAG